MCKGPDDEIVYRATRFLRGRRYFEMFRREYSAQIQVHSGDEFFCGRHGQKPRHPEWMLGIGSREVNKKVAAGSIKGG
jgi:hypothetical protein